MTTPPSVWTPNGASLGLLYDASGNIIGSSNPLSVVSPPGAASFAGNKINLTAGGSLQVKAGAGILHAVIINTPVAAETLKLYDGLTAVNIFATITIPATITAETPISLIYDVAFTTGLFVAASSTGDFTIVYL